MAGKIPATGQIINRQGSLGANKPAFQSEILYVNKIGEDGWLQARLGDSSTRLSLCKYTKVKLLESKKGITYFKVLDGSSTGKILSLMDANVREYLGKMPPLSSGLEVVVTYGKYEAQWVSKARENQKLDQQWAILTAGGLQVNVTMNTVWGTPENYTPLPVGEYTIRLPDSPHNKNMTGFYRKAEPSLKYDQVWFPIEYGNNSRYVHVGNVSEGCVTVVDLAKWADIHEALISHRSPDGKSVGKLIVKGKPQKEK
jgi:hypothetical protein